MFTKTELDKWLSENEYAEIDKTDWWPECCPVARFLQSSGITGCRVGTSSYSKYFSFDGSYGENYFLPRWARRFIDQVDFRFGKYKPATSSELREILAQIEEE